MNQSTGTGFFKQNKGLELGFMVIGIALFIVLGMRGLQRIGDMRVAAGERNRTSTVQANADLQANEAPSGASTISTLSLQETPQNDDKSKKSNGQDKAETEKTQPEQRANNIVETSVGNTKKQNI